MYNILIKRPLDSNLEQIGGFDLVDTEFVFKSGNKNKKNCKIGLYNNRVLLIRWKIFEKLLKIFFKRVVS